MISKFKVKSRWLKTYTRVWVYDSIEELRKDASTHNESRGLESDDGDILGVSHHYVREVIDKKGKVEKRKNDVGIIRLSKDHLTTEIVAHELLHAALWHYRMEYGTEREFEGSTENADFGTGCCDEEENLCHIYGQMFRDMTKKLYKLNLWN